MEESGKHKSNKNILFLLIFLCFAQFETAQAAVTKNLIKSTFTSESSDPYSFVKQQLRYLGFREAISNELKSMNLDVDVFWAKYEEKFNEAFLPTEEKLKRTYGIEEEGKKVSTVKKVKYKKQLRKARLSRLSRFGNLAKVISRFSVKKISRSTKNPNRRFMRMKVKVNRRILQRMYLQFVNSQNTVKYDRLILHPRIELANGAWTDLGVSSKNVLESALYDHWQTWFVTNFSELANLIELEKLNGPPVVISAKKEEESDNSTEVQTKTENGENSEMAQTDSVSQGSGETSEVGQVSGDVTNIREEQTQEIKQLHVFIEVNVNKTFEDELENYRGFAFKIFANVIDGQTGELVASADLSAESQSFSTINVRELSSNVASAIYNLPLKDLEKLKTDVLKYKSTNSLIQVSVDHYPAELIKLKSRIEEIGLAMGIEANVIRYIPGNSEISINYLAQDEKFTSFLVRLNELEFVKNRGAAVEFDSENQMIQILVASQETPEEVLLKEDAAMETSAPISSEQVGNKEGMMNKESE